MGHHGATSQNDFWIVKLDPDGHFSWQKCLGGSLGEMVYALQQTTDGGYILAGRTTSQNDGDVTGYHGASGNDYWVVKLDSASPPNLVWQKALAGSGDDYGRGVCQTSDGGYMVVGEGRSTDGDITDHYGTLTYWDFWIVKLDPNGNVSWTKSLGGTLEDDAECVKQTSDGGFIIAGYTSSTNYDVAVNKGSYDFWIKKYKP